jgi:DNA-binding MarR family transcriptional regulator
VVDDMLGLMAEQLEPPRGADLVLPALLTAARRPYGEEIRRALSGAGFTDMPRAGSRLVGGIARNGPSVGDTAAQLGVSKQAASQLIDTLVLRGYVERRPDPDDRRRLVVDLTDRGRAAAHEIRAAVERVDGRLEAAAGADRVVAMRATLAVLAEMDDPHFA